MLTLDNKIIYQIINTDIIKIVERIEGENKV